MARVRLDVALAERGLAESREKAQALILAGKVRVAGQLAHKAGQLVSDDADLAIAEQQPYVSRGGYKLAHALDTFALDPAGLVVLDVGASTGGFTDVLLQRGVTRVYAVDVGRGQLHWRLRTNPRVVTLDRTNIRHLHALPERPSLATADVSFISLRLVVPAIRRLIEPDSSIIALVKPQFEAGRGEVGRGGVVRSPDTHRRVLEELLAWLTTCGLHLRGLTASPIRGPAGNAEFLAWLAPSNPESRSPADLVEAALRQVHAADDAEGQS
jgi:23S rRNA (cytidine1920-2'-O)/16S rRNA (cytidine1409-2'-O)-methyltransferase